MEHPRPLSFVLPNPADIPVLALQFLDGNFEDIRDLFLRSSNLTSLLKQDTSHLNDRLLQLRSNLTKHALSWISTSLSAKNSLDDLRLNLQTLTSLRIDGKQINQELHQLVEELCRIQNTHKYFVTVLKLESLVGDLEDSVFHPMHKKQSFNLAIKTMNEIEDILGDVTMHNRLVASVDSRVEKSLSTLRPRIIAEHRALLSSLGWPPKLVAYKAEVASIPKTETYSKSFLLLCGLQQLITKKEKRKKLYVFKEGLLPIDELVIPIASRMEYHFMKWEEQPEFIFELVYKFTSNFADGVDDFLQPLIDKAKLVSCSGKEAWVSSMVQMVSGFLEKKIFPKLVESYKEKHMKVEVTSSWFHLVDQMITFDKRMESLVNSDTCLSYEGVSVMGVFCKRSEWLKTWGKIELKDAYRKLKEDIKNDKAWVVESNPRSTREDYRAPFIADSIVSKTWMLIERGLSLHAIQPRIQFVRATATKFLWYVFKILLLEFKKIDLSEDTLVQACGPINAARYLESKLREWSDDLVVIEMSERNCFFEEELKSLGELETNWLMDIITVCLHQFDNLYIRQSFEEDAVTVSIAEALDSLRRVLCVLQLNMNSKDFLDLWRNLAEGLDHYVSSKFFSGEEGTLVPRRFEVDVEALLTVFQPYCVRPVAFFPRVRDILKMLRMKEEEKGRLRGAFK